MKKLSLLLLLITSIFARENPFVETTSYTEEIARLMEIDKQYASEFNDKSKNSTQYEDTSSTLLIPEVIEQKKKEELLKAQILRNKILQQKEDKKKALEIQTMKNNEKKARAKLEAKINNLELKNKKIAMKKEEIRKEEAAISRITSNIKKDSNDEIIYVKKRVDVKKEKIIEKKITMKKEAHTINPLPFVNILYSNNNMTIETSKYKYFRKRILEDRNKIIFDFKATKTNFYTKYIDLQTDTFEKISIGNHPKEKYYRIVIKVNGNINDYIIKVDKNLVNISYK